MGVEYTVRLSSSAIAEFSVSRNSRYAGYSDHKELEIVLDPAVSESARRETLWHEIKHCLIPKYKPSFATFKEDADFDFEEWYIALSSPGELGVLRQNPDLVAYLMDGAA
jgi:hypothetical protein